MTVEELMRMNWETVSKVQKFLDNFEYVESMLRMWNDKQHPLSTTQRKRYGDMLCAKLEACERLMGSELSIKTELRKLFLSDAAEDFEKISTALPRLRGEIFSAIRNTLTALEAPPIPIWSDLLPEPFAAQVLPPFRARQYLSAVRRGCDALRAVIRTKTGLHHLDGVDLVNQAYGKNRPFVVAVWEGHSENDVRNGYTDMLRGAMMAIRNPHYHGTDELTETEAARLLVMLATLWARADSTTRDEQTSNSNV